MTASDITGSITSALAMALRPFAEYAAVRSAVDEAPDHVVWEARTGAGRAKVTRADFDRAQQALRQGHRPRACRLAARRAGAAGAPHGETAVPVDLRRGAPPVAVLLDEGEDELPAGVLSAAARAYRVRHPSDTKGRPRAPVTNQDVVQALQGRSVAAAAEFLGVSPTTVRRRLGRSTRARTAPRGAP